MFYNFADWTKNRTVLGVKLMKTDEQILRELEQGTVGLSFMSESDYPFEVVRWGSVNEMTPQYLRGLTDERADAPVEVESLEDFFGPAAAEADWKGAAELETAKSYQALMRMLKDSLEDVRVYKVGRINIPVYIIGRSSKGSWLGLSTRVVET
jgi:hypothetical protein